MTEPPNDCTPQPIDWTDRQRDACFRLADQMLALVDLDPDEIIRTHHDGVISTATRREGAAWLFYFATQRGDLRMDDDGVHGTIHLDPGSPMGFSWPETELRVVDESEE